MFPSRVFRIVASVAISFAVCMPVYATTFTSAEFLKWETKTRDFYVRTTVGTASLIARQNDKRHAKCLEDWYFGNERKSADEIYNAMKHNNEVHPRAIVLAMLQKKCGTFTYRN